MKPITILKLGGSAITDKSNECTPNLPLIHDVADQIASYRGQLILLHGAGSYGHPLALRARLNDGYLSRRQLGDVSRIELQIDELSRLVQVALLLRNIPFAPINPLSCLSLRAGSVSRSFLQPIASALKLGLTPLLHGDIVFDEQNSFGVLSADMIASYLAERFPISRVLFGTDVEGVMTGDPGKSPRTQLVPRITRINYADVERSLRKSTNSDASGGMLGKFSEAIRLARKGCQVNIFSLKRANALRETLMGTKAHGTMFVPWKSSRSKRSMD